MISLLIKIVLFIAFIALLIFGFINEVTKTDSYNREYTEKQITRPTKKIIFCIIPLGLLILSLSIKVIPANTVGVRWSAFGGTSEQTLDEGIAFIVPFADKVYEIDTTVQERSIKDIRVQTKDAQNVTMQINVKYRINRDDAFKVYKGYRTLDNLNKNIIRNYSEEALLKIGTQYNVIDILGDKNNEFHDKVAETLTERFANEGVEFKSITFKDIDAGKEIEKAISDEAVAKKAVETAEQKRLKAEKDAETKIIKAQAEADANAILTEKLTDAVLQKMFIETWDGKLPTVYGATGNLLDLSNLLK